MKIKHQQQGFALLIFVVVLLGALGVVLNESLKKSLRSQALQDRTENIKKLAIAKEALLSFSVDYARKNEVDRLGLLPCPDSSNSNGNNGNQNMNCGDEGVNSIGYLPYKSLGLGKFLDSAGECFWYVVSGNYKNWRNFKLTNWDTNGLLNVVDENGNLLHGSSVSDKPIALIISPGKKLNQDRYTEDELADCQSNYTVTNYLEGGDNINYATDLPATALAEWSFLQSSFGNNLEETSHNDQIIAIYRDEFWEKVKSANNDLTVGRSEPKTSAMYELIEDLAMCMVSYMNEADNVYNNGFYPATVYPDDYRESDNYVKSSSFDTQTGEEKLYGLFPENIQESVDADGITIDSPTNFVTNYCVAEQELNSDLWQNWKSHFLMITAMDFEPGATVDFADKCATTNTCIRIGSRSKVAAIIFFAKEATILEDENDDDHQDRVNIDQATDFNYWEAYIDDPNRRLYRRSAGSNQFGFSGSDYLWCIVIDAVDGLVAEECQG